MHSLSGKVRFAVNGISHRSKSGTERTNAPLVLIQGSSYMGASSLLRMKAVTTI